MMKRLRALFQRSRGAEGFFPPTLPLSLDAEALFEDPYSLYAWLRANAPVAPVAQGGFLLTRHADVMSALSLSELGNAPSRISTLAPRNAAKYVAAELASRIPPFTDKPAHPRLRKALSGAFYATLKPFVTGLDDLASEVVSAAPVHGDVIADIGAPFAEAAMARFVGLPPTSGYARFSGAFFHLFAPIRDPVVFGEVNQTLSDFRELLTDALKTAPPGSLLSCLGRTDLSEAEIVDNAILIFADGIENAQAAVATLLQTLPERGRFETTEGFIEEVLRRDTPAQIIPRVARTPFSFRGTEIGEGVPVYLALGSANHDETVFVEPEVLKPGREGGRALTFGQGRHSCIGAPLARALLGALVKRFVEDAICADGGIPGYHHRIAHRWPSGMTYRRG
jgi:cytochrome P450